MWGSRTIKISFREGAGESYVAPQEAKCPLGPAYGGTTIQALQGGGWSEVAHGQDLRSAPGQGAIRLIPQMGSGWALQQNKKGRRTSLAVQWLKLHASAAWGTSLIPAQGTKIPHALGHGQKKKRERERERKQHQEWSVEGIWLELQKERGKITGNYEEKGHLLSTSYMT